MSYNGSSTIKVITSPSVFLVGRQQIDDAELSRFLADEGVERWDTDTTEAGQKLVEVAGRLCYHSYARPRPGGNAAYIGHILEVGHGSVAEHCVFSLIITGISRSLTHELVRHRAGWSYSQLSQRFVDESDAAFVVPPAIEIKPGETINLANYHDQQFVSYRDYAAFVAWHDAMREALIAYNRLVKIFTAKLIDRPYSCPKCDDSRLNPGNGWCPSCEDYTGASIKTENRKAAREAARSVLPSATETKIFVTVNARALRHFLELRGSRHADAEINRLALMILGVVQKEAPNIFGDYRVVELPDGKREITTEHRKV